MATTKNSEKKVTKMTRSQLNEMINYQIDQKVCNYIVESQGITLKKASTQLNESAKDGFKALKQSCKNQAVKAAIFTAIKALQGAVKLLDGEAKTDLQSMVNVMMALTADQTGIQSHAYGNGVQNQQWPLNDQQKVVSESKKLRTITKKLNESINVNWFFQNIPGKFDLPLTKGIYRGENVYILTRFGDEEVEGSEDKAIVKEIFNDPLAKFGIGVHIEDSDVPYIDLFAISKNHHESSYSEVTIWNSEDPSLDGDFMEGDNDGNYQGIKMITLAEAKKIYKKYYFPMDEY